MMEFHISREARERYQFSESLFSYNGNVVFADMPACRAFAHRMNQVREADKNPDQAIHAGALFAMGLIDEASHVVIARYREQFDRNVMADALAWFGSQMDPGSAGQTAPDLRGILPRLERHARRRDAAAMAAGIHYRHSPSRSGARRVAAALDRQSQ